MMKSELNVDITRVSIEVAGRLPLIFTMYRQYNFMFTSNTVNSIFLHHLNLSVVQ